MRHGIQEELEILTCAGVLPKLDKGVLGRIRDMHMYLDLHEPGHARSYHTWDHVLDVLAALGQARRDRVLGLGLLATSSVATLFHDCIFAPGAMKGDNEEASASRMSDMWDSMRSIGGDYSLAYGLILDTADHLTKVRPVDDLTALFLDADLAGLASPWPRFVEQNIEIDNEMLVVKLSEDVQNGRRNFLTAVLGQQTIYLSSYFGRRLEWQARDNVQRLLQQQRR